MEADRGAPGQRVVERDDEHDLLLPHRDERPAPPLGDRPEGEVGDAAFHLVLQDVGAGVLVEDEADARVGPAPVGEDLGEDADGHGVHGGDVEFAALRPGRGTRRAAGLGGAADGAFGVREEGAENATDVLVIGGGTGGYSTALRAAALGLHVVLAERDLVGGTCLHRGCIPSKAMLHAAELVDGIAEARERRGVKATLDAVDWPSLVATRDDIVSRNHRGVEGHLAQAGVRVVRGSAELTGPRSARIEGYGEVVAGRGVVLATGSRPRMLPGQVADGRRVVTSDDALYAPGLPGSVLVVGGGAIGVEYTSFHRSMGADVTLVEAAERLVPLEDVKVSRHLTRGLKKRSIQVETGARLLETAVVEDGVRAVVRTGRGGTVTVAAERLLVAVGREPVTDGLGLAAAGLTTGGRGHVRSPWIRRAGAWTESSAGSSSGRSSPGPRRAPGSSRRAAGR